MQTVFEHRLRKLLDEADFPQKQEERIDAFAKSFDLKHHEAHQIVLGKIPEDKLLTRIAQEFEVSPHWLRGADQK